MKVNVVAKALVFVILWYESTQWIFRNILLMVRITFLYLQKQLSQVTQEVNGTSWIFYKEKN